MEKDFLFDDDGNRIKDANNDAGRGAKNDNDRDTDNDDNKTKEIGDDECIVFAETAPTLAISSNTIPSSVKASFHMAISDEGV